MDWLEDLCTLIRLGNLSAVETVLKQHQLPGISDRPDGTYQMAQSPLHTAISLRSITAVDMLLKHNMDVTVTNLYGETALHVACRTGDTAIVERLLTAGSEIDCRDCGDATPLFHAVYAGKSNVAELLIRAGADMDTLNEEMITPLDYAITYNDKKMISLLLRGGCSLDKTTGVVFYPGHYSNFMLFSLWGNGDLDNVSILMDSGYKLTGSHVQNLVSISRQIGWDNSHLMEIEKLLKQTVSLKRACRMVIRRQLSKVKSRKRTPMHVLIQNLPLPAEIREFVSML